MRGLRLCLTRLLLVSLLVVAGTRGAEARPSAVAVAQAETDSVKPRYSVRKTYPETFHDLAPKPVDLKDPEGLVTEVVYDEKNNIYKVTTKVGSIPLGVPLYMTPEEYSDWSLRRSMEAYYKDKNDELLEGDKHNFDLMDMKFDLGPAEKIFGPGGVQIKTQGSAELKFGMKYRNTDNPTQSEATRKNWGFDFDEKININVNGKVGDKIDMNLNYNTDATFDFDTKQIKLKYEGKEDEIIKLLEAGNVSMPTNSTLIRGATSLFGIRTDLQFGKLKLQAVVSQQESESKTVTSKGGGQTKEFEITVDDYEENRHFFLGHFFRDSYDNNMSQLPNIVSGISITRIEVWVTNKRGNYDNPRNILAFADLGERNHISNPNWQPLGTLDVTSNNANTLYSQLVSTYAAVRNINEAIPTLSAIPGMEGGTDYEKIESARLLTSSEYTLNASLGYISLRTRLQPDEVLAVAYEYTYRGQRYQVGEFSSDIKDNNQTLFLKLLKSTSNSPGTTNWDLMMKNVYSLDAYQVQKEDFRLDILYQSDTTGTYLNYIPEGQINKQILLRVLNLDRLDNQNQPNPNGFFDYVDGYTVIAQTGQVIFPVIEPFGSYLRSKIGNDAIADKYVFQELYDSTKTVAQQTAEKNKFILRGEYKSSSGAEISLGAMNVPQGSVVVTAGGVTLTENVDYTVDYTMGIVTILNQSILDAGTPISVNCENNSTFSMQRKTMVGLNFTYDFTKDFQLGGTIMHLSEKPLTTKVNMGDEPIANTLWGLNMAWKNESQFLTNLVSWLPGVSPTTKSTINLTAEFAHLIPGKVRGIQDNASYIDDFESTKIGIDIRQPSYWMLASVPQTTAFPESSLSNDIDYGKNRALMSWYYIDPMMVRKNSSIQPDHLRNDLDQLSNHYVREVYEEEIFPNRETSVGEASTRSILNVAYYPDERGPYNLDTDLNAEGKLNNPEKRFGAMMRKLDMTDFESSNIEYIEFWLLDPFIYADESTEREGGDLYINLGDISEDILKDGKKFFENGMPVDGDASKYEETVWGRVPTDRSIVYAFDNTSGARAMQDVGLNGLNSDEERSFATYSNYLNRVQAIVSPQAYERFNESPSGDLYHYYRGSDYDAQQLGILDRYKYYTGTEGNSTASDDSPESYDVSSKSMPDVEDINQDNTLNEFEKYFQYKIELSPEKMNIGENYISDIRTTTVRLRNGNDEEVSWYQFKIPVNDGTPVGNIKDFKSIRFIRMYLTNFAQPVVLRFASLELVRGEWRTYEKELSGTISSEPLTSATIEVSAVNIEENADRTPVNYVLPPGISRVIDPGQPQLRQDNEQALSLKVTDLQPGDARAVYKNTGMDLRRYKRLQMFVHAEAFIDDDTNLEDGQVAMFIRLGSDYKNNYYEYEIPLDITPEGDYDNNTSEGRLAVWPSENMLDIAFDVLTNLKKERNTAKNNGDPNAAFNKVYFSYDPDKPANKISIIGNPSLAEVKTIMIGVRNNSRSRKSAEVWVNELRLTEFSDDGGWAAQGNLNLQLSDLGSVTMAGHIETAGFGGLDQSVSERRLDDYKQYSVTANIELGKFLPEKVKLTAPLYYSISKEITTPKYNPFDQDMLMKDVYDSYSDKHQIDSIKDVVNERVTYKNFSISNLRFDITSKNPMPYDPSNFTFGYSSTRKLNQGNTTQWEKDNTWQASFGYNYASAVPAFQPFKDIKSKNKWLKFVKEFALNYVPQNISFNTDMSRHYYELQLRDLENTYGGESTIPLSFSKDFLWNRDFALRWDLTKNLRMNFSSATNAEIEEPYGPVNKDLYPDEYEFWKDSVKMSIASLGRPVDYNQSFTASYKLPFDKIPLFDWLTSDVKFSSSYNWERGAELTDGTSMGNIIDNQRTLDVNGKVNLEALYNKCPWLKAVNKKFSGSSSSRTQQSRNKKKKDKKEKDLVKVLQIPGDTVMKIEHNFGSRKVRVSALDMEGNRFPVKYKVVNKDNIRLTFTDSANIKLTIKPGPKLEEEKWYKMLQCVTRFAMMVRNVSVTYRNTYAMTLPGYMPEVGDMLGQKKLGGRFAPGLAFAFGMTGDGFIEDAARNGWLMNSDSIVTPATSNAMEDFQIRATLEPFRDFKIELSASRTVNKSRSIQFMFDGMPSTQSGNFQMTTIAIGSAFERSNGRNGYSSKAFERFVSNLDVVRRRLEQRYAGATYPVGTALAGQRFDPANGTFSRYSSDVMVPAFLAAYTGRDINGKHALDIFPSLLQMLPNWRVTYNGLSKLDWFKRHFKSFNINHAYRCTYAIGSYNTFQTFTDYMDGFGFVEDVQTGNPVPSSMYDITTVSINEQFSPLIGVDMTFHNSVTAKVEYKQTRVLTLSMAANQIVESGSKDIVFGLGYTISDVKLFGGGGGRNRRRSSSSSSTTGKGSGTGGVNNDIKLRADFSWRNQMSLCRDIQDVSTQATQGNRAVRLSVSADYTLSSMLTLRLYYDYQRNMPLVSSSSYPVTNSDFGVSVRLSLTR